MVRILVLFFSLGLLGLLVEVIFTSFYSLVYEKDKRMIGSTSFLMLPVYGVGGLFVELTRFTFGYGFTYIMFSVVAIGITEFVFWKIFKCFKIELWNYGTRPLNIKNAVNVAYAPYWAYLSWMYGFIMERI